MDSIRPHVLSSCIVAWFCSTRPPLALNWADLHPCCLLAPHHSKKLSSSPQSPVGPLNTFCILRADPCFSGLTQTPSATRTDSFQERWLMFLHDQNNGQNEHILRPRKALGWCPIPSHKGEALSPPATQNGGLLLKRILSTNFYALLMVLYQVFNLPRFKSHHSH